MPDVLREDTDGIAVLSLNRPDALNALRPQLWVELVTHLNDIAAATDTIGCVVLRANGRSFSAGNDLKALTGGERTPTEHYQADAIDLIEAIPQPVIASAQGHCLTGALELVLGCTLFVVADNVRIADTHGQWGMSSTWGMSQRLPRRIGTLRAMELMLTGREITGPEAVEFGLANKCVPVADLDSETMALARHCVGRSWHTLVSVKRLVGSTWNMTLTEGLAYERETSGAGPDMDERLAAFGKK